MRDADGTLAVPVPNSRVRATYDRAAGLYARTVARLEAPSQRRTLAGLDLSAGDTVVDVGCGPGRLLPDLAGRVGPAGRVFGVDAAPAMLAEARDRARQAGCADRISLAPGDARRLPVADGAADAVCALDVLDLFDRADLRAVLAECRRVLAPDGQFCAVTMDRESVADSRFLRAYEWAYRRVPGFGSVGCRPIPAAAALREAGFEIRSVDRLRRAGVWPVAGFVCTPDGAAEPPG
jgi:ubiquinone/menaquinone biosynthesis C-methylase UbiE